MTKKIILPFIVMAMIVAPLLFRPGFVVSSVSAQTNTSTSTSGDRVQDGLRDIGSAYPGGARQGTDVKAIVRTIINWALYLAAIISVIFIIIGGFMYITSAGNEGQAGKGRTTLVNALIGLTIVVLSYLIVQIVYNFLVNRT